jgi:hypothetical protein
MLQAGKSGNAIAHSLSISAAMVSKIRAKITLDIPWNKGGRPSKLTTRDHQYCTRLITSGKVDNAAQLQHTTKFDVCKQTLRNALKKEGMRAHVKAKKPLLRKHHYRQRLNFAKKYQFWTLDDWARVIFSDETKINRMGSDGRVWCWGMKGAPLTKREVQATVKHGGGSVMIWGCFSTKGVGKMWEVDGTMDANQYMKILDNNLLASARSFGM